MGKRQVLLRLLQSSQRRVRVSQALTVSLSLFCSSKVGFSSGFVLIIGAPFPGFACDLRLDSELQHH